MKKLPKHIYVYRSNEGTNDEYLSVADTPEDTLENDFKRENVGIYELKETIDVSAKVVTTRHRGK